MADSYVTKKIHKDIDSLAKKKNMSVNELFFHQKALIDADRTTEQENQLERLKALEGIVGSLVEALKHQRYLTDTQSKKIDEQTALIAQQSDMLTKLLNAYRADIEFIQ
jgi:hypothetical protein